MGLCISHGIGIPFQKSSQSWIRYWANQSEVLFFGLYSEISGGQMPNKVTGATDYLTVSGSAGAETYQCPNTAEYIDADENVDTVSDYIWFKTDESQRTVTTAELIGYDFGRTIIYYEDSSPNSIVAIMILKEALSETKMNKCRTDFHLSIWWDNTLNLYGNVKSNRGIGQTIWTVEPVYAPEINGDGKCFAWYRWDDLSTITKNGGSPDLISQFNDFFGSGNNLVQASDAHKPTYDADGILHNGGADATGDNMRTGVKTLSQPVTVYFVMKPITWGTNLSIFDGDTLGGMLLRQYNSTPNIAHYAGVYSGLRSATLGTWFLVTMVFNGASSLIQLNDASAWTGNVGANNANGFVIGSQGGVTSTNYANFQWKDCIIRKNADDATTRTAIKAYLKTKNGLSY